MAINPNQTLIQGAFKQEQAKAMSGLVDMRSQFASDRAISGHITSAMADTMSNIKLGKEQKRVAFEKGLEPFKKIANNAYETLYSQGEPLPQKFIDAVTIEVERLQDDFEKVNTEGKGDTRANERERLRIRGELKRITNEAINTRANFMKIGQSAGDWNTQFIKEDNVAPMQTILDLKSADKNDDYKVDFIDGKLTATVAAYRPSATDELDSPISMPEEKYQVSFNSDQMWEALPSKNKETDAAWVQSANDALAAGELDAKNNKPKRWDNPRTIQRAEETFAATITTPKEFQDNIRKIDGVGADFIDDLWNNVDIPMAVLATMFVGEGDEKVDLSTAFSELNLDDTPDKHGNQVINSLDYDKIPEKGEAATNFESNIEALHDALTNINNPAFHLGTSVDLLAKYKIGYDIQAYNDSYNEEMGEEEVEEGDGDIMSIIAGEQEEDS